jgi:hypothetical protein
MSTAANRNTARDPPTAISKELSAASVLAVGTASFNTGLAAPPAPPPQRASAPTPPTAQGNNNADNAAATAMRALGNIDLLAQISCDVVSGGSGVTARMNPAKPVVPQPSDQPPASQPLLPAPASPAPAPGSTLPLGGYQLSHQQQQQQQLQMQLHLQQQMQLQHQLRQQQQQQQLQLQYQMHLQQQQQQLAQVVGGSHTFQSLNSDAFYPVMDTNKSSIAKRAKSKKSAPQSLSRHPSPKKISKKDMTPEELKREVLDKNRQAAKAYRKRKRDKEIVLRERVADLERQLQQYKEILRSHQIPDLVR